MSVEIKRHYIVKIESMYVADFESDYGERLINLDLTTIALGAMQFEDTISRNYASGLDRAKYAKELLEKQGFRGVQIFEKQKKVETTENVIMIQE